MKNMHWIFLSLLLFVFGCNSQAPTQETIIEKTIVDPIQVQSHIQSIAQQSLDSVVEVNTVSQLESFTNIVDHALHNSSEVYIEKLLVWMKHDSV